MSVLKDAQGLFDKLKGAYKKGDASTAQSVLTQLRVKLIQLPAVPPNTDTSSKTAQQELQLARDVYEHAVLVALKSQDDDMQESAFTQLKTFYDDTRHVMPQAPQEWVFAGLNLLRLLLANRIAEFHTELELIPDQGMATEHVRAAIQLEQWLMEGAYNKVLAAGSKLPPECSFCVDQLSATVREEIASCSEAAYSNLRLADAQKLMMFKSPKEAEAYAKQRGWTVADGVIHFHKAAADDLAGAQHMELINHTLVYAKELERIV